MSMFFSFGQGDEILQVKYSLSENTKPALQLSVQTTCTVGEVIQASSLFLSAFYFAQLIPIAEMDRGHESCNTAMHIAFFKQDPRICCRKHAFLVQTYFTPTSFFFIYFFSDEVADPN